VSARKDRKTRLDMLLVEKGLADDPASAARLVMAGRVVVGDQRVDKPGHLVDRESPIRVKADGSKYVSRGGDKLASALEQLGLWSFIEEASVLDVGASTGGFTDCCLQAGARSVIALDVGTGQLAWELRSDPRVISLEKTDLRDFNPSAFHPIDIVVADVSFNSLARLAPEFRRAAPRQETIFLLLVKPQFELGREDVPSGGIITDPSMRQKALERVKEALMREGLQVISTVESGVSGRKGNQEIFVYAKGQVHSA
jgi:23S rRNA (cytidine1920-2'-O)/16S rRNA (cytidine1409-2'-O)-methyltransferase